MVRKKCAKLATHSPPFAKYAIRIPTTFISNFALPLSGISEMSMGHRLLLLDFQKWHFTKQRWKKCSEKKKCCFGLSRLLRRQIAFCELLKRKKNHTIARAPPSQSRMRTFPSHTFLSPDIFPSIPAGGEGPHLFVNIILSGSRQNSV